MCRGNINPLNPYNPWSKNKNPQKTNGDMTDYTIPMIIGMTLAFTLGAGFGSLWGLGQHRHIYDWLSASLISRMQRAMRTCGYSQDEIDMVTDCMGCRIMPPDIPCPPPPEKPETQQDESIE
jgi:hypothetical protein